MLELKDLQFFYLAVIVFGVIGFQRGWRREVISLVFALSGVVFLYFGMGKVLAQFFLIRLPIIIQLIFTGEVGKSVPNKDVFSDTDPRVLFTTLIAFLVVVTAGYIVGNRTFPRPATPQDRILGVIPAVIAGFSIVAFLTNFVGKQIIVAVDPPSSNSVGNYISIIFVIVIAALIIGLMASRVKKSAPKK